ncbi:Cytochrome C oxidase, cbb3-type, subunit III [Modicisalibacter ilicicola DSM 19980]|uniref:Cytochrome C oxidase, cbb3-type, subunit III n=1 Tax=Modicisalibacter ilicicola DSM 19980 TaxID=1121942 RepID=A0A1M5AZ03_9GAMM|nr:c-type cytochrome [Halomonas ilicicola]SHF35317.1 Cytochrome C oxidase, cbb3-type, subunit III [Halomonas ilicicola DSM 19980]
MTPTRMSRRVFPAIAMIIGVAVSVMVMFAAPPGAAQENGQGQGRPGDYIAIDGKVDQGTYDGYIAYTRACLACHGPDGLGSSFAPSLIKRVQQRTFSEFSNVVAAGLQIQPDMVMPSFADDDYVLRNIENIYSYMKGRAAGDIGRGRPRVIDEAQGQEPAQRREEDASAKN